MIYLPLHVLCERITVSPKEEVLCALRAIEPQFVKELETSYPGLKAL